jgi:tetratricopeptide (TPR) repeat protein
MRPEIPADKLAEYESKLAEAAAALAADPESEDAVIWVGRRLAYLGRYREAIDVFTNGLKEHPDSFKLLRHRGHRYITVRNLKLALDDLFRAASLIERVPDEAELDGMPNAHNTPTSTSHTNIFYHLGLAQYLRGEFREAASAYQRCMEFAKNDDMRCATAHWLCMSLRRLGEDDEARAVVEPIHAGMTIIENVGYHRLLLMYKGELQPEAVMDGIDPVSPDGAAVAYGVANWHWCNGEHERAVDLFKQIVSGKNWAAFGYIAAEAELARMAAAADRQE